MTVTGESKDFFGVNPIYPEYSVLTWFPDCCREYKRMEYKADL